jgi:hypothetical protein
VNSELTSAPVQQSLHMRCIILAAAAGCLLAASQAAEERLTLRTLSEASMSRILSMKFELCRALCRNLFEVLDTINLSSLARMRACMRMRCVCVCIVLCEYGLIYMAGTYCNDVGTSSSHCTATVFEAQLELLLLLQAVENRSQAVLRRKKETTSSWY